MEARDLGLLRRADGARGAAERLGLFEVGGVGRIGEVLAQPVGKAQVAPREGLRGIALFPAMHRYPMNAGAVHALLEVADRYHLNVFVHCGVLKVAFRTKLGLPCPFDPTLCNPLSLQRPADEDAGVTA